MAIVKYVQYQIGGNSTPSSMQEVINYCLQPHKTHYGEEDRLCAVSGLDCNPEFVYDEFMATKVLYGKENGIYFYHYVQAFHPDDDLTPEEANRIGMELAKEWAGHEVLVATHVDRKHLHNHIIINSVSHENGLKLRQTPSTLKHLRKVNDRICMEHGLSTLPPYEKKDGASSLGNREYYPAKRGNSWKFRLRNNIKIAMEWSYTREEFIENMFRLGYGVRWEDGRKNITYTCFREDKYKDGKYRKCNDDKLSEEKYLKEVMTYEFEIRQRSLLRRADEAQRNTTDTAARAHTDGTDDAGGLGTAVGHDTSAGKSDRRTGSDRGADDRNGRKISVGDEENGRGNQCFSEENAGENGSDVHTTGWESERNALGKNRTPGDSRRCPVVGSVSRVLTPNPSGVGTLSLLRVASAGLSYNVGDKNKTPEEIEAEERARLAASNAGLVLGSAIGVALELHHRHDDKGHDAEEAIEENNGDEQTGPVLSM
jgi:hypothetical protein